MKIVKTLLLSSLLVSLMACSGKEANKNNIVGSFKEQGIELADIKDLEVDAMGKPLIKDFFSGMIAEYKLKIIVCKNEEACQTIFKMQEAFSIPSKMSKSNKFVLLFENKGRPSALPNISEDLNKKIDVILSDY